MAKIKIRYTFGYFLKIREYKLWIKLHTAFVFKQLTHLTLLQDFFNLHAKTESIPDFEVPLLNAGEWFNEYSWNPFIFQIFDRLIRGIKTIEKQLSFAHDSRLGFLTFCPTNLGTTIRASVLIKIPLLLAEKKTLDEISKKYNLQVRSLSWFLSNKYLLSNLELFSGTRNSRRTFQCRRRYRWCLQQT